MNTEEKFKAFIDKSSEEVILNVASEFLPIEQIEKLLLQLDEDTKNEILDNF